MTNPNPLLKKGGGRGDLAEVTSTSVV